MNENLKQIVLNRIAYRDRIKQNIEIEIQKINSELFNYSEEFETYWDLHAFISSISTTKRDFNITMTNCRDLFLKRKEQKKEENKWNI